ncbi:response regulator transcription factor [Ornithinibacillus scapharcae]|uniref:response regulator transcription factor n=1 Tax=Ornithinibacillus scapharcae TaxID=1147159 RepID=UPI000225BF1F|nr:response regulator transcription factor [Ornithinibacillus scapharcae]
MSYHIGVIEDDPNIRNIVSAFLKKEGYEVSLMDSAEKGLNLWESNPPDMWIVDIMLPGMDGYEFCKKIRNESEVPIIIVSAKDEEIDKILGLELGGDDYLTKPFSPRELMARIKRIFKRYRPEDNRQTMETENLTVDMLTIDKVNRRVFWGNEEIDVTTKEFDMLLLFAENVNRAFSREELLMRVWGEDYFGSDRAVDDLVKRIRKKFQELPLETVWGFGYRLRDNEE